MNKLAKWLNEFVESQVTRNNKKSGAGNRTTTRDASAVPSGRGEQRLRGSFVKVSDKKRKYQPLYKELTNAPTISFEGSVPESPFERVTRSQNSRSQGVTTRQVAAASKKGYCELCAANFANREQHMKR